MAIPKILITSRVWVPKSELDFDAVKEAYTTNIYDENSCRVCEYRHDRHSYMCDTCPAFKEKIVLFAQKHIQGKPYVGLPVGDKLNIERKARIMFESFKIVDKRTDALFDYDIKFTAKLRPIQEKLAGDFLKKKYGMIVAPPRTGKSITMLYVCLKLGRRTIFMANQREFLTQIMDHIHGNEEEGIPKCTNLPELEKKTGKKLYGFPKTDEDFENFQIVFMTYQSFISEKNGKNRLHKVNKNFGTLGIDEVHKSSAKCFAATISAIRSKFKLGCSGTLERKDCFVGDTLLAVSNDTLVPIQEIVENKNDYHVVLSKNKQTGEIESKPIVERHTAVVTHLIRVWVNEKPFLCTPDHEWWSKTRNSYVAAKDLVVGEELESFKSFDKPHNI